MPELDLKKVNRIAKENGVANAGRLLETCYWLSKGFTARQVTDKIEHTVTMVQRDRDTLRNMDNAEHQELLREASKIRFKNQEGPQT